MDEKTKRNLITSINLVGVVFLFCIWVGLIAGIVHLTLDTHWSFMFLQIIPMFIMIYVVVKYSGVSELI